jgi:Phospholipase_D-nuclease N-terminal/Short C-terminal domain
VAIASAMLAVEMQKECSVILADVSFMDIFWSMLWFFFLFIWIIVLANILTDLFRDQSLSGVAKTLWVVFLVFLPFLAALVYFLTRGRGMAERAAARQEQTQEQFAGYVRSVATSGDGTPAEQIARAKELLDAGTIDQSEFDRLKAKALS